MAAVLTPSMAEMPSKEELENSLKDLSLFNMSPMPGQPLGRLTGVYYSNNPLGHSNRTDKLLLRREQRMEQHATETEQYEKRAMMNVGLHLPNLSGPNKVRFSNGSQESSMKHKQLRISASRQRRKEFYEKRRSVMDGEVKKQLALNNKLHIVVTDESIKDKSHAPTPRVESARNVDETPEDRSELPVIDISSDLPEGLPGFALRRRSTLLRSSSFKVRNENTLTRQAVGAIEKAYADGRNGRRKIQRRKTGQEIEQGKIDLARKYAMLWMSNTAHRKRMNMVQLEVDYSNCSPFTKFRKAARLIKSLIQVCRVCQEMVLDSVSSEDWYKKIESYIDSTEMVAQAKGPSRVREFTTWVPGPNKKELVKLTFDKSLFARERRSDYLLTESIRKYLKKQSCDRTIDEKNEVLMFMKRAVPSFNSYSREAQRHFVQCMHYDKYDRDRVITRQGLTADGMYFILSGTLLEQDDDKKNFNEMKPGQIFGEEDIICGCPRRSTVITRSEVELVSVHRLDYRAIVHMADDTSHPQYLEICRHDIVFQHFPMKRLVDNPGVLTLLSYKYGRLIVKDSNEMEWIYIIKSGEAKVIKELTVGQIDLTERRRTLKAKRNKEDPHANQSKLINFVSERDYLKSQYRKGSYSPGRMPHPNSSRSSLSYSRHVRSAPISYRSHTKPRLIHSLHGSLYMKPMTGDTMKLGRRSKTLYGSQLLRAQSGKEIKLLDDPLSKGLTHSSPRVQSAKEAYTLKVEFDKEPNTPRQPNEKENKPETVENTNESTDNQKVLENHTIETIQEESEGIKSITSKRRESKGVTIQSRPKSSSGSMYKPEYIDTSLQGLLKRPSFEKKEDKKTNMIVIPRFVQLESLHAGKVFGLRSCLPPDERGPSASLVSGGCEVLQVNKKFFMKHADEALIGLIRVQNKPFPTEDDLIDRLDNNFQWEEFKQNTVGNFLVGKGRMNQDDLKNITINLTGS